MNSIALSQTMQSPSFKSASYWAAGFHLAIFIWNPPVMTSSPPPHTPALMQVEFREALPPPPPPPVVKKIEKKEVVKKAKKSGISLAKKAPAPIRAVKKAPPKVLAQPPAPKTRVSAVKMPKFIPRSSDEMITTAARPQKLATATTLRPAAAPFAPTPKLKGKSRGVSMADVNFQLTDRGSSGITGGGAVVNIPIGDERSDVAVVTAAPQLHDVPKGRRTSNPFVSAPMGDGMGELAGKNRSGYVGSVQVTSAMPSDEEVFAAGKGRGVEGGKGVEIGGPVGDRKILRRNLPEYPAWAEEKGISAIVKIFFTVKPDGSIRRTLRVVHSSGYAELDSLAKDALLAWKFSPTGARSTTEEAWGVITFRFTLA